MKKIFVFASALASFGIQVSSSATLEIDGVGTYESGPGSAAALEVGTVIRFSSIGTSNSGTPFDALLTVNALSATASGTNSSGNSAAFSAAQPSLIRSQGNVDVWGDFTLTFTVLGLSDPVELTGVTTFVAQDIDSQNDTTDLSDVFGLFNAPGAATRGSSLEAAGFIHNSGQPTAGVDYTRLDPAGAGNTGDFVDEGGVGATETANWATYDYGGANLSSIQFVWGATTTGTSGTNFLGNRGTFAQLNFDDIAAVPEPSTAGLVGLFAAASFFFRRR